MSRELDAAAEEYCVNNEPTDTEAFKAGANWGIHESPEVKELLKALDDIADESCAPLNRAKQALAQFNAVRTER